MKWTIGILKIASFFCRFLIHFIGYEFGKQVMKNQEKEDT